MPTRAVTMLGDGFVPLLAGERSAFYLAIYASVVKPTGDDDRNFRYPVEKGFYGYIQTYDGQSVVTSSALSYRSQLIWKNVDCCQLVFTRICELGAYIKQINTGLTEGFSASFNSVGVSLSASFPDSFPDFQQLLITNNPSSVAFRLEPNAVGELVIVSENLNINPCVPEVSPPTEPDSCGGVGTPPTQIPAGCIPVPSGSQPS